MTQPLFRLQPQLLSAKQEGNGSLWGDPHRLREYRLLDQRVANLLFLIESCLTQGANNFGSYKLHFFGVMLHT